MCPSFGLYLLWVSKMSSIGPMEFSKRCAASLDLPLPYLKSRKCSWNRTLNGLPVWPVYFMLNERQVNWYIPLFSYLLLVCSCLVRSFSVVLFVPKVTLTLGFLNIFVMALVSVPTYVNLIHLFFSVYVCVLSWCWMFVGSTCRTFYCIVSVVHAIPGKNSNATGLS